MSSRFNITRFIAFCMGAFLLLLWLVDGSPQKSRDALRSGADLDGAAQPPSELPALPGQDRNSDLDHRSSVAGHAKEPTHGAIPETPQPVVRTSVRTLMTDGKVESAPGVSVLVRRPGRPWSSADSIGTTDPSGKLVATLSGTGQFEFSADEETLPAGFRTPGSYRTAGGSVPGISLLELSLGDNDETPLEIWLLESRVLAGIVVDATGKGLGAIGVEALSTRPGQESVSLRQTTDPTGAFEFANLFPIAYALRLGVDPDQREKIRAKGLTSPPPQFHDLSLSSVFDARVSLVPGPLTVKGPVLDETGAPFPDLDVLAYYKGPESNPAGPVFYRYTMGDTIDRLRTDSRGQFRIEGVRVAPFAIQIGAQAATSGAHGSRRLLRGLDRIELNPMPDGPSLLNVGDLVAPRNHPFEISGILALTKDRHKGKRLRLSSMVVDAVFLSKPDPEPVGWGIQKKPSVQFDKRTGAFTVRCDTPRDRIAIRTYPYGREQLAVSATFYPIPDGRLEGVELLFPE